MGRNARTAAGHRAVRRSVRGPREKGEEREENGVQRRQHSGFEAGAAPDGQSVGDSAGARAAAGGDRAAAEPAEIAAAEPADDEGEDFEDTVSRHLEAEHYRYR